MDETEIEVFRVGGKASRGIKPEHLAEVAAFDVAANPVGICFGHPKSDTPAAGTISALRAEGNSLFATVKTLTSKAVEGIKSGEWLNRSMAFFDPDHEANPTPGKWAPRHLGLLGAAAPGIPGMGSLQKALAFDADGGLVVDGDPADAVIYTTERASTPTHFIAEPTKESNVEKTPEQIAEEARIKAADDAVTARETAFAARVKTQFEASNSTAIDALVTAGKVLPAEVDGLKLAFNSLDAEADELTFGAGDKATKATAASHILAFMANAIGKRAPVNEAPASPTTTFNAGGDEGRLTAAQISAKARAKMEADKSLSFEAAVEAVQTEADQAAA